MSLRQSTETTFVSVTFVPQHQRNGRGHPWCLYTIHALPVLPFVSGERHPLWEYSPVKCVCVCVCVGRVGVQRFHSEPESECQPDVYIAINPKQLYYKYINPSRPWNNAHGSWAQQCTWLVHSIALDMKVGYLQATYTLSLSLRNECCIQTGFAFSAVLPVVKVHKSAQGVNTKPRPQLLNVS